MGGTRGLVVEGRRRGARSRVSTRQRPRRAGRLQAWAAAAERRSRGGIDGAFRARRENDDARGRHFAREGRATMTGHGRDPAAPTASGDRAWVLAVERFPTRRVGNGFLPYARPTRPWVILLAADDPGAPPGKRWGRPGDVRGIHEILGEDPPAPVDVTRWALQRLAMYRAERGTVLVLRDAALAEELARALPAGFTVELLQQDHQAIEALRDELRPRGDRRLPRIGEQPRIPPDALRSYHEACRRFVEAAPWRFLTGDELLRVDAPTASVRDVRFFRVLGRGDDERGLLFFRDSKHHYADLEEDEPTRPPWIATMLPAGQAPPADEETWERLGVPPIREGEREWVPFPVRPARGRHRRPDLRLLGWFDLVFRAMAATRPGDVDEGAWTVTVERDGTELQVTLAHTGILGEDPPGPRPDPMDFAERLSVAGAFELEEEGGDLGDGLALEEKVEGLAERFMDWDGLAPIALGRHPVARALDIAIAARVRPGRSGLPAIREALARDPDCPEALRRLAEVEPDPGEAERLLRRAAHVALERWGTPAEANLAGGRPLDPRHRVTAHVLVDLGRFLLEEGRPGEAVDVLRRAVGPPPKGDPRGARILLLRAALEAKHFDLASSLAGTWHRRDTLFGLTWRWVRLLLDLREAEGRPGAAWRARLEQLVEADPRVAFNLLWRRTAGAEEADLLAWAILPSLDAFPGLVGRLYEVTGEPPAPDDLAADEAG